jgi:hypothetical protein
MTHLPYLSVYAESLGFTECFLQRVCVSPFATLSLNYLDSPIAKRVEVFVTEGLNPRENPKPLYEI